MNSSKFFELHSLEYTSRPDCMLRKCLELVLPVVKQQYINL